MENDVTIIISEYSIPVFTIEKKDLKDMIVQARLSGSEVVFAVTEQKYYDYYDLPVGSPYRTVSLEKEDGDEMVKYSRTLKFKKETQ